MKGKEKIIVSLIVLLLFFSMSVGYALYETRSTVEGNTTFVGNGDVIISSAVLTDYKNLQNPVNPTINGRRISFDLNFFVPRTQEGLNDEYYVTYQITITNDSVFDYSFTTGDFSPSLTTQNEDVDVTFAINGIDSGEVIPRKDSKTFTLTINMIPNETGNINVSGDIDIGLEQEDLNVGNIIGSIISSTSLDLVNNTRVPVTVKVINSYSEAKTYDISVINTNFYLVDEYDNPLTTYSIGANQEQQETVYIKITNGARFATNRQDINLFITPTGGSRSSIGLISLTVPKDNNLIDLTPPTIGNIIGTMQNTKGSVIVTFNGSDNVAISKYTLEVYKDGTKINTYLLGPDISSYVVTNLEDGSYSFKVIAEDTSGLTAEDTSTTYNFDWTMDVVINITQGGPNGTSTVDYGHTFTTTITADTGRNIPATLTITMGGQTLNTNSYTYNTNNGNLSIPNVTGDLNISGATTGNLCLIEGTKVLLANNTYKNIEDIKYDDLLMVWNYETGKVTKEYPIWMEKEKVTNEFTNIEFSDGSSIGVVGAHAFFNGDINEFVSVDDKEKFHIGSTILKIENNKLKKVKVTKIEKVNKKVKYYFVASTRYWNIITNDFITTDGYTDITNLYEFDENISWSNNRKIIKVNYYLVKDVLPYYLFKGFRAEEVGVLIYKNRGSIGSFKEYVNKLITSSNMLKEPIMKNNNRYWMVTTSEDKVINKKDYLVKEGDYYILPEGKWYSTSENKIYKGNTKVQVWTGMYFEKIN